MEDNKENGSNQSKPPTDQKINNAIIPSPESRGTLSPKRLFNFSDPENLSYIPNTSTKSIYQSVKRAKERFVFPVPEVPFSPSIDQISFYFPVDKYKDEVNKMYERDIVELAALLKDPESKLLDLSPSDSPFPTFHVECAKYEEEFKSISTYIGIERRLVMESWINKKKLIDANTKHTVYYLMKSIVCNVSLLHKISLLETHFSNEEYNSITRIKKRMQVLSSDFTYPLMKVNEGIKRFKEKYLQKRKILESKFQETFNKNRDGILRTLISSGDLEKEYINERSFSAMLNLKNEQLANAVNNGTKLSKQYNELLEKRMNTFQPAVNTDNKQKIFEEVTEEIKQLWIHRNEEKPVPAA